MENRKIYLLAERIYSGIHILETAVTCERRELLPGAPPFR
jgi:hypothetical protein